MYNTEPLMSGRNDRQLRIEYMAMEIINDDGSSSEFALWMLIQELLGQVALLHDRIDNLSVIAEKIINNKI